MVVVHNNFKLDRSQFFEKEPDTKDKKDAKNEEEGDKEKVKDGKADEKTDVEEEAGEDNGKDKDKKGEDKPEKVEDVDPKFALERDVCKLLDDLFQMMPNEVLDNWTKF